MERNNFKPISPRLAILKIELNGKNIALFQIHAPTTECDNLIVEDFYDQIRSEIMLIDNKKTEILLIGDFNASIGEMIKGEESLRGESSFGKRNKRGSMFMNFVGSTQMKIVNTYYGSLEKDKWTWLSPKSLKFEIDYMLIRNKDHIKNFYIQKNLKFESDHRMLVIDLMVKKGRHNNNLRNKPNLKIIKSAETYKDNLEKSLNTIPSDIKKVQQYYQKIISSIREAIKLENETAQTDKSKRISDKLSGKTKELINKREELNKIINKTEEEKIEHRKIRKLAKKKKLERILINMKNKQ